MNQGRHKKIYPKEIYKLRNIKEQSPDGKIDILAWENDPTSTANKKGFVWHNSPEGDCYWRSPIGIYIKYKKYKK